MMVKTLVLGALTLSISYASLITVGTVASTGNGIGAVNTSLTFQNTGTEVGCVGAGAGGTKVTGTSICPSGFTGGDEKNGASQTNLFTAPFLGISSSGTTTFANLVVLFNGNEGGGPNASITLNNLALVLYDSTTGAILPGGVFTASGLPTTFADFPGVGSAGLGFQLDSTEAAQANALLTANPTLLIGTAASASDANAGPETIQLTTLGEPLSTQAVPEPASLLFLSVGLGILFFMRERKRAVR